MLLKQPHIGRESIIFEVISVISVVISVILVISVNRRTVEVMGFTLRYFSKRKYIFSANLSSLKLLHAEATTIKNSRNFLKI